MIVGYLDRQERVFCATSWLPLAREGARPLTVLDTEDPDDSDNNLWIVDPCAACGRVVSYKAVTALA